MEAGLEQERLQQEAELNQKVNEEEVQLHANRAEPTLLNCSRLNICFVSSFLSDRFLLTISLDMFSVFGKLL